VGTLQAGGGECRFTLRVPEATDALTRLAEVACE
jgi:hypothetical protein